LLTFIIATTNLLFEPVSNQITGLFDFDFGRVAHPLHEYVENGFRDFGGSLADDALKDILISGVYTSQPPPDKVSEELWELAKTWDAAITRIGVTKPSNLAETDVFLKLNAFNEVLLSYRLYHPVLIKRYGSEEKVQEAKRQAQKKLSDFLDNEGY
jgi:hypothetical protein